jgi:uroporphyrin-III C-methyltransferase
MLFGSFSGKVVHVLVDNGMGEHLQPLVDLLSGERALVFVFGEVKSTLPGAVVVQRKPQRADARAHVCIVCGSAKLRATINNECLNNKIWRYVVGAQSDFTLPQKIVTHLITQQQLTISPILSTKLTKIPVLYLVGAGPGAVEMLTIKALHLIKSINVIIADRLVSEQVLSLIPATTKVLFARKVCGRAREAQDEIYEWMLTYLKKGISVIRLKGGDPFLFGRGGEEWNVVLKAGFKCKYIPGISSSICAAGLAGIPTTHRTVADQVLISTGTKENLSAAEIGLYIPKRTIVLLMAMSNLERICTELILKGQFPASLSCAVIERASYEDQRVIEGRLDTIAGMAKEAGVMSHATVVIGQVVGALERACDGADESGCDGYDTDEGVSDLEM